MHHINSLPLQIVYVAYILLLLRLVTVWVLFLTYLTSRLAKKEIQRLKNYDAFRTNNAAISILVFFTMSGVAIGFALWDQFHSGHADMFILGGWSRTDYYIDLNHWHITWLLSLLLFSTVMAFSAFATWAFTCNIGKTHSKPRG